MDEFMLANQKTSGTSRIRKLDSVRGVAAVMVLIGHTLDLGNGSMAWWLGIFGDGVDAVVMFFLLSGYVLALQLASLSRPTYAGFLIRRVCRIWPAFAVTLVASFFLLLWAVHLGGLSARSPEGLNDPGKLTAQSLALNLLMANDAQVIDPPVWSLFVEMRASIVFPLLMILVLRANFYFAALVGIVFSVLASRLVNAGLGEVIYDVAATSRFLCLFVVGAALTRPNNPCERLYAGLPTWTKNAALVLAVALIEYRFWPDQLPAQNYIPWIGVTVLFVICLYSSTAERFLDRGALVFLGRISYGVYLVHFPIVALLRCATPTTISSWWLLPAVLALSVLLSWALYVWVEKPMMVLGRNLSPPARLIQ